MRVDRQARVTPERNHARDPDGVEARHDTGAAETFNEIVSPAHLVDLAGQVERVHGLMTAAVRAPLDDAHDLSRAVFERASGTVRLQFIVLDKVDARLAKIVDEGGGLLRCEADRRLHDSANEWPSLYAAELARASD